MAAPPQPLNLNPTLNLNLEYRNRPWLQHTVWRTRPASGPAKWTWAGRGVCSAQKSRGLSLWKPAAWVHTSQRLRRWSRCEKGGDAVVKFTHRWPSRPALYFRSLRRNAGERFVDISSRMSVSTSRLRLPSPTMPIQQAFTIQQKTRLFVPARLFIGWVAALASMNFWIFWNPHDLDSTAITRRRMTAYRPFKL